MRSRNGKSSSQTDSMFAFCDEAPRVLPRKKGKSSSEGFSCRKQNAPNLLGCPSCRSLRFFGARHSHLNHLFRFDERDGFASQACKIASSIDQWCFLISRFRSSIVFRAIAAQTLPRNVGGFFLMSQPRMKHGLPFVTSCVLTIVPIL